MFQDSLSSPLGTVTISSQDGLSITDVSFAETDNCPSCQITQRAKQQLLEYFAGTRQHFDLQLAPVGTVFQLSVWHQLQQVPFGQTASYRDVAQALDNPKGVRAVGMANSRNPIAIIVPCHRIIGADGSLTGYA